MTHNASKTTKPTSYVMYITPYGNNQQIRSIANISFTNTDVAAELVQMYSQIPKINLP